MVYNINYETLTDVIKHYIKVAKQNKGELVVFNKIHDEADEFIICDIKDFEALKIKKNDFLEVTIYDSDDDDIAYSEFLIGNGDDNSLAKEKILGIKPTEKKESTPAKQPTLEKNSSQNHFQKFMKKK
ncbi:MAG: hypothetical protein ACRCXY_04655 [Fusobacteriaceae bacterium]